jgi:MFS family permease
VGPEVRRTSPRLTFAVLAAGVLSYMLLQSMVIPVLPTLQADLGTTQADITWVLTANLLAAAVATPIAGRLGDILGKRRVFVAVLALLSLGCLLSALADSLPLMVVGRVLQGVGGGAVVLGYGIVREEFHDRVAAGAIGGLTALIAVGVGGGLVIAGPIDSALGTSWLFWLPMGVTAVAAVLARFVLSESRGRAPGRVNWTAALLLSAWLVCLLLGVNSGTSRGWTAPAVVGLMGASAFLLVLWIVVETHSSVPLIDMRTMRLKAIWAANLVALAVGFTTTASFAFIPQFLQTAPEAGYGFGMTISEVGLILLPQSVASFLAGIFAGRLGQRYGARAVVLVSTLLLGVSFALITVAHDNLWQLEIAFLLLGAGAGSSLSALAIVVVAAVPHEQTGAATGVNANLRTIGGSIGGAVMATVVTAGALPGGRPAEAGYTAGFLLLAVIMCVAALATAALPSAGRSTRLRGVPDGTALRQAPSSTGS